MKKFINSKKILLLILSVICAIAVSFVGAIIYSSYNGACVYADSDSAGGSFANAQDDGENALADSNSTNVENVILNEVKNPTDEQEESGDPSVSLRMPKESQTAEATEEDYLDEEYFEEEYLEEDEFCEEVEEEYDENYDEAILNSLSEITDITVNGLKVVAEAFEITYKELYQDYEERGDLFVEDVCKYLNERCEDPDDELDYDEIGYNYTRLTFSSSYLQLYASYPATYYNNTISDICSNTIYVPAGQTLIIGCYLSVQHSNIYIYEQVDRSHANKTTGNCTYMTWIQRPGNGVVGEYRVEVSADAPVGWYGFCLALTSSYRYCYSSYAWSEGHLYFNISRTVLTPAITSGGTGLNDADRERSVTWTGSTLNLFIGPEEGPRFINLVSYTSSDPNYPISYISRSENGAGGSFNFQATGPATYTIVLSLVNTVTTGYGTNYSYWIDTHGVLQGTGSITYLWHIYPPAPIPKLYDDPGVNLSLDTKAVIYDIDGNTIRFKEFENDLISFTCTSGMSQHTLDGTDLTLIAYEAKTYTITFSLRPGRAIAWEDGVMGGTHVFYLIIQIKQLDKPQLVYAEGVAGNIQEVEYDGSYHQIALAPALERYVVWTADDGVSEVFHAGGILTLQAKELGEYTIKLAPVNSNVKWLDNTATPQTFILRILPRKVEIPIIYTTFFNEI